MATMNCHASSSAGEACWVWACTYFHDEVCGLREKVSFVMGLASVLCWGVAEVPQILTNFREQSTEGVSLLLLLTWILGDCFNVMGCYLEPSTLPTQLYMALLYTVTTLVLLFQAIYYDHILKPRKMKQLMVDEGWSKRVDIPSKMLEKGDKVDVGISAGVIPIKTPSAPVVVQGSSLGRDRYYRSARSLASSHTPAAGSYLAGRGPGSLRAGNSYAAPLLHPNPVSNNIGGTPPRVASPVLRAVISSVMFVGGLNIHGHLHLKHQLDAYKHGPKMQTILFGRKLFQAVAVNDLHSSSALGEGFGGSVGLLLGWLMAAVYMGGRLPQIWLNIKRGSVEGLSPFMFTFAVLGNVTYMGSILIRSAKWSVIKSNMPWLVDAGVCVILDVFIIIQFLYYYSKNFKQEDSSNGDSVEGAYNSLKTI